VRPLLIILLAIVLPLKAVASVAMPLAGSKQVSTRSVHHQAGHAAQAHGDDASMTDADCCDGGHSGALAHECPHGAMPLLAAAPVTEASLRSSTPVPMATAPRPASVVLDVLDPPPLPF
jgi:hypothetical protein